MSSPLALEFRRVLPVGVSVDLKDEDLEAALRSSVAAARHAWPGVELDDDVFVQHVSERMSPGLTLDALHVADLYLALGCLLGDPRALQAFEGAVLTKVPSALRGSLPDGLTVDDVVQQLRVKLFVRQGEVAPRISGYSGRGALVPWVRAAAVRLVQDAARGARREVSLDDEVMEALPAASGGADWALLKQRYAPELKAAVQQSLSQLSSKEQSLLRLTYLDGLSPEDIGRLYQAHRTTVWRWLSQARESVLDATRRRLAEQLRLADGEFSSLMRDVQSQLDVSISRMLRGDSEKQS